MQVLLRNYSWSQLVRLWFAAGLLLGACQSPPPAWPAGKVFTARGHRLTYRAEHFRAAATRPFLVDTIALTTHGARFGFDPEAKGADTIRQWKTEYGYGAQATSFGAVGVIENDTMLWLHPPREGRYKILELSPFPYIKLPAHAGQRWLWPLIVGDAWADTRWAVWRGQLLLNHSYQTSGQQQLNTSLGLLTCWLVRAQASCPVGTSSLDSYYHPQLGFVRLAYHNINGSRLTLNLVDTAQVTLPPEASPATYLPKAWQLPASR